MDVGRVAKLIALLECKNGTLRRHACKAIVEQCRTAVDATNEDELSTVKHLRELFIKLVAVAHCRQWPARVSAASTLQHCLALLHVNQVPSSTPLPLHEVDVEHVLTIVTPLLAQDERAMNEAARAPVVMSARQQRRQLDRIVEMEERTGVSTQHIVADEELLARETASTQLPTTSHLVDKASAIETLDRCTLLTTIHAAVLALLECSLMACDWETRHGSALALVNVIGAGGGDHAFIMATIHTVVHTLCADRFTDFSTATCIAPVRETCAQLLAVCLRNAAPSTPTADEWTEDMVNKLGRLSNAWETRQSALLVVKYVSAWNAQLAVRLLPLLISQLTPIDGHDELAASTAANALHAIVVLDTLDDGLKDSTRDAVVKALQWYTRDTIPTEEEGVSDPTAVIVQLLGILERIGNVPSTFAVTILALYKHADADVRRLAVQSARALPSMDAELVTATYVLLLTDTSEEVVRACGEAPLTDWSSESLTITLVGMLNASIVDPHNPIIDPTTMESIARVPITQSTYMGGEHVRTLGDGERAVHVARRQRAAAHFIAPLLGHALQGTYCATLMQWLVAGIQSCRASVRLQCLLLVHALHGIGHHVDEVHQVCLALLPSAGRTVYEETSALYARVNRDCIEFVARCISTSPSVTPPKNCNITRLEEGIVMCQGLLDRVNQTTDRKTYAALYTEMSTLRTSADNVTSIVAPLQSRAHALLAATIALQYTADDEQAVKLTPVIKPIMTALSTESVPTYVKLYSRGLARLAPYLATKTPSPMVKIVRNLATMLVGGELPRQVENGRTACAVIFEGNFPLRLLILDDLMKWSGEPSMAVCQAKALFIATDIKDIPVDWLVEHLPIIIESSRVHLTNLQCVHSLGVLLYECAVHVTSLPDILRAILGGNDHLLVGVLERRQLDDGLVQLVLEWLHITLTGDSSEVLAPYTSLFMPFALTHVSHRSPTTRTKANTVFGELVVLSSLDTVVLSSLDTPSPSLDPVIDRLRLTNQHMVTVLANPNRLPALDLATVPLRDDVILRHYQVEGVTWLAFLQRYNLHGILADDMGLGKTLQTLVALQHSLIGKADTPVSLIVCPRTLIGHWVSECSKYFTDASRIRPIGIETVQHLDKLEKEKNKWTLVVTSYEMLRRHEARLCANREYHYAVLDEGHIIRNSKSSLFKAVSHIRARHRAILSGTPVQNNVTDLWSLMQWLMPDYLGTWTNFNGQFAKPILLARDAKTESSVAQIGDDKLSILHKRVLPFTLRRLKEEVLAELPDKIVTDIYADMTDCQRSLYDRVSEQAVTTLRDGTQRVSPLQVLTYLRKLCNHPRLVDDSSSTELSLSGKMLALQQLLVDCGIAHDVDEGHDEEASGHRALIFCQYKSTVQLIAEYFDDDACMYGVNYLRLDGTIPAGHRHDIAQQFNNDSSINVLLLTTQIGGVGLNLTGADTVIMVEHDFNPARDMQAIDRAHRLGQKRVVNVYRLITRNSLEEKVIRVQGNKRREAGIVIGTENTSMTSMATDQLLQLLTNPDNQGGDAKRAKVETSLEKLWEENEYEDAFNVEKFVQQIGQK